MGFISVKFFPKIKKTQEDIKKESDDYVKRATENITGIREIKALGIKKNTENSIFNILESLFNHQKKIRNYEIIYYSLNNLVYFILEFVILLTAGIFFIKGKIIYSLFIVIQSYLWRVDEVVETISDFGVSYNKVTVSLKRIDEIVNNKLYEDEKFGDIELDKSTRQRMYESVTKPIYRDKETGETYTAKVVGVTDYGAFVELEPCIEGMVYKSELSWVKNADLLKTVNIGDEVNVKVLEVIPEKHKISPSIKRCLPSPYEQFASEHPIGSKVSGTICGIKEFGIFITLNDVLTGTVAMRDISWDMSYDEEITRTGIGIDSRAKGFEIGQTVETVVLVVDPIREIIRLGIKQATDDPYARALEIIKIEDTVHGTVSKIGTEGMVVTLNNGLPCLLKRMDVGRNGGKKFSDYKEGEEVDALVTVVNSGSRYVQISVNALDLKEQKTVLKKVNSENMNSKLGDILGESLGKK